MGAEGGGLSQVSTESFMLFQRKLENLEELQNEADLVVNCCGLGAVDLVEYKIYCHWNFDGCHHYFYSLITHLNYFMIWPI